MGPILLGWYFLGRNFKTKCLSLGQKKDKLEDLANKTIIGCMCNYGKRQKMERILTVCLLALNEDAWMTSLMLYLTKDI